MMRRKGLRAFTVLALAVATVSSRAEDTLTLVSGRQLHGEVTQTDEGYVVKTKGGIIKVGLGDVAKWDKAAPPPPGVSQNTPLTPPPVLKQVKKEDPLVVTATALRYIHQGVSAMKAGALEAGLENFLDARFLLERNGVPINPNDPAHFAMLEGGGAACLFLNQYEKANDFFDRAYPSTLKDRSLVFNRAVLDFVQHSRIMRGIKDVKEFLARQPAVDEPALNLMGASLASIMFDGKSYKLRVFIDAGQLYESKNKELEATRPGEKHWGVEWMSKKQYASIQFKVDAATADWKSADDEVNKQARNLESAQGRYDYARSLLIAGKGSAGSVNSADNEVARVREVYTQAINVRDEKWKAIPRPDWPKQFTPVMPGFASFDTPKPAPPSQTPLTPTPPPQVVSTHGAAKPTSPPGGSSNGGSGTNTPPVAPPPVAVNAGTDRDVAARDVIRYAVAIPVAPDLVLTAAAPLLNATEVVLENPSGDRFKAQIMRTDATTGLALVRAAGQKFLYANLAASFTGGEVNTWGYPEVSVFNPIADKIAGNAAPPKSVGWFVSLRRHPRLMGSAIFDKAGALVGLTLGERSSPPAQMPAVGLEQIKAFLGPDAPNKPCPNGGGETVLQMTASR